MASYRSSALLAAAAVTLGAALVPVSAYAAAPDAGLSTADLVTALKAAQAPTATSARAGWIAQGTDTPKGAAPFAIKAIYALDRGLVDAGPTGTLLEAQHSGTYLTIGSLGAGLRTKQALKAVRKPHATWLFTPDASLDLQDTGSESAVAHIAPDLYLQQLVDPARTTLTGTPTRAVAADGSTTYTFAHTDLTDGGESGTDALTISPDDVVTAISSTTAADTTRATFAYGPQSVSLPSAATTITLQRLVEGTFLATLPRQVKAGATRLAQGLTRRAHGRAVKVSAIRAAAKRFVGYTNRVLDDKVFTSRPVAGGVKLTGTNRFLHQQVSYAVTAAGTKAVARRA